MYLLTYTFVSEDGNGRVDLLASGGDDEMTPLHDAVNVCRIDVVRLLLKHGGRGILQSILG